MIEFLGDVARQFQVLLLVVADRHGRRLVKQDVGRHQRGIGIKPERHLLGILAPFAAGLVLELGHAAHPAHTRHAIENPAELGVFHHLALVEDDRLSGIETSRDIGGGDFIGPALEVDRVLPDGDGMHVDDTIERLMRVL